MLVGEQAETGTQEAVELEEWLLITLLQVQPLIQLLSALVVLEVTHQLEAKADHLQSFLKAL